MKIFTSLVFIATTFLLAMSPQPVQAQDTVQKQNVYYKTYPEAVTVRVYASKKYAQFTFTGAERADDVTFKANTKQTLGIGATYKKISLNLGYGFPFLNNGNEDKGKTKSLDAQVHFYPRKWLIDAFATYHNGAYIKKGAYAADHTNTYYSRRDALQNYFGISAYHVWNGDEFSYRAAMLQNEWQTKSAGSLLVGVAVNFGSIEGDSTLLPEENKTGLPQPGITQINFITAGPGIGYAYTLVMAKHFFVMASLVANITANYSGEKKGVENEATLGLEPGAIYKTAIGYNSDTWTISGIWAGNTLFTDNLSSTDAYRVSTGAFRLVLARRLAFRKG